MKAIKIMGRIAIMVLAAISFLIALGTYAPIPVVGSVASYITIQYAYIFLPILGVLLVLAALYFVKSKAFAVVAVVLVAAALCMSAVTYGQSVAAFRAAGAKVSILNVYLPHHFDEVQKDSAVYDHSDIGDVVLDVYYTPDGTDKAVVVYIHGGGWTSGDRNNRLYSTQALALRGCVSISVDYDLSDADRHLAATCEKQLTRALGWVAQNAARYGGSADRIYLLGDSAGGNLALNVAYKVNAGAYAPINGTTLPIVAGVCALYPVADPAAFYNNPDLLFGAAAKKMCVDYTGVTPQQNSDAYSAITPAAFLSNATPPTLLIVGEGDKVVDPVDTYALHDALLQNGTDAQIVRIPYANHAFDYVAGGFGADGVVDLVAQWCLAE